MNAGRPKSIESTKGRTHSLVLSRKAEIIFRRLNQEKKTKRWIHKYVSEKIIQDFGGDMKIDILIEELREAQHERDRIERKIEEKAEKIKKIKFASRAQT